MNDNLNAATTIATWMHELVFILGEQLETSYEDNDQLRAAFLQCQIYRVQQFAFDLESLCQEFSLDG